MKLRKPEPFCVLNEHDGGVRDIDSNFDDGRGDEYVTLTRRKCGHRLFLLFAFEPAVKECDAVSCKNCRQFLEALGSRFQIDFFGLFNYGIDDIGLMSLFQFASNHFVNALGVALHDMDGSDWRPTGGHLINDGEIEIAVQRHSQCPGNRSCRHNERIGIFTLCHELQALDYTKTVLLVDDDHPEVSEKRALFKKRVCSYNHLDLARGDFFEQLLLLRFLGAAPDNSDPVIQGSENSFGVEEVLLGQNLGRRH